MMHTVTATSVTRINYPDLIIGLIMAIYWWRVLRMAYKMRRQTGRAANFIPAETLGRALRFIWQPVVWIWVTHPLISAFSSTPFWLVQPVFNAGFVRWLAVALAIAAFAATRMCWKRMGRNWRMGIDPTEQTQLIVTGAFAYVRNPIYALSNILMLCTMIVLSTPLMLFAGVLHILLLQWESRREETHLLQTHGEQYRRYRSAVGRFVPRGFRPYQSIQQ